MEDGSSEGVASPCSSSVRSPSPLVTSATPSLTALRNTGNVLTSSGQQQQHQPQQHKNQHPPPPHQQQQQQQAAHVTNHQLQTTSHYQQQPPPPTHLQIGAPQPQFGSQPTPASIAVGQYSSAAAVAAAANLSEWYSVCPPATVLGHNNTAPPHDINSHPHHNPHLQFHNAGAIYHPHHHPHHHQNALSLHIPSLQQAAMAQY